MKLLSADIVLDGGHITFSSALLKDRFQELVRELAVSFDKSGINGR